MNYKLALAFTLLPLTFSCAADPLPGTPGEAARGEAASNKAPVLLAQSGDEFEQMIEICAIEGGQLERFRARVSERHTRMEAWNATPEGERFAVLNQQRIDARRSKDAAALAATEAEFAPLSGAQSQLRSQLRAQVMQELNADQLARWAGHVLWTQRKLSAVVGRHKLTPEQAASARQLGDAAAAKFAQSFDLQADPYMSGLYAVRDQVTQQIVSEVLTPEQRAAHTARQPATQPAPAQ